MPRRNPDSHTVEIDTIFEALSRIPPEGPRRAVLAFICAKAPYLPWRDPKGKVIKEADLDADAPLLTFANSHKPTEEAAE